MTEESDCLVVVVSEETGHIRIAEGGTLSSPISRDAVADEVERRLQQAPAIVDDVVAGARNAIRREGM